VAGLEVRDFSAPDETRAPDKTKVEIVHMGGASLARMSMQPGWRWSECIKPVAGTDNCKVHHIGVLLSGTLHVSHEDGTEQDIGAGDAYVIEPGHEAWVVGDEPVVGYEFDAGAIEEYAKG
jgi:mannose-6-phosphate isomerase-like protein (cupin superfamily)